MTIPAPFIEAGAQVAGQIGNGIFGLATAGINDARQIRQQRRLNKENARYNKEMTTYNLEKQMEMWERTGYGATKDQMKRAGINPALLYGMSGGGGQSTNVDTSNQGASQAPAGGGEIGGMMGMGIQAALAKSTIALNESQANKNNADAAATSGYKQQEATQSINESKARIEGILQGVDNAKMEYEIKKLEITMKNIENYEKQASQEDRLEYIKWNAEKAGQEVKKILNENYITAKTIPERIKIVQEAAIGAVLNNQATKVGMAVDQQKIKESVNEIMQKWDRLERTDQEIMLKRIGTSDQGERDADRAIEIIGDIMKMAK